MAPARRAVNSGPAALPFAFGPRQGRRRSGVVAGLLGRGFGSPNDLPGRHSETGSDELQRIDAPVGLGTLDLAHEAGIHPNAVGERLLGDVESHVPEHPENPAQSLAQACHTPSSVPAGGL
jgi:hypothetical protein